ncbi:hypothetical protein SAMN05444680_104555 [Variovorax sp. YR216]|nr:hypothetical protein SAMN05444680_104555 [Variovorax sp. YR216]
MKHSMFRRLALWLCLLFLPAAGFAQGMLGSASALQAKHAAVQSQLSDNPFGRPLVLESAEASGQLSGNIFAVLNHPFSEVSASLSQPAVWCDVLMLHLNTKYCAVRGEGDAKSLAVSVGRKFDQPLSDAQRIDFVWKPATVAADFLSVGLGADKGPLSTRDYRIELEATPLPDGKSFIHLSYSYGYGAAARIAMQGYLKTIGSDKVGFTANGKTASGEPDYIGGVLGVVERNTMRYYLAIDAFLDQPTKAQLPQRLALWFDSTERYARQLHEVERQDYLAMKRNEYKRMNSE